MGFITELFNQYGYIVLYVALTLELIALPTPGETLMIYCGFLVFQGQLDWIICITVAAAGVITGITISYFLGYLLDEKFIVKYGSYFHINQNELEKKSKWFIRYGNGLLIVSYFIPGVRHITGYLAGITKIPYKKFAINSYIGAIIWTSVFISLGKILGPSWEQFHATLKKYLIIGGIIAGFVLISIYFYKSYKQQMVEYTKGMLKYSLKIFHSLGKVKIAVLCTAMIFLGLIVLTAGLIQDLLANEFGKFDTITIYITSRIFNKEWSPEFNFIKYLTSYPVIIILTILIIFYIKIKGRNRILEVRFLLSTVIGGEILEETLRIIFHRFGPLGLGVTNHSKYTFPSEQSLMALLTYGFAAFIIIRHYNRRWVKKLVFTITLAICILSGISPVFFNNQFPSDVIAGYVFGGAWLSINIVLLEVFRILPEVDKLKKN